MNRKWLLGTLFSAGIIPAFAADYTNIILVNLDDVGYGDFSCNGAYGYKTPTYRRRRESALRISWLPSLSAELRGPDC